MIQWFCLLHVAFGHVLHEQRADLIHFFRPQNRRLPTKAIVAVYDLIVARGKEGDVCLSIVALNDLAGELSLSHASLSFISFSLALNFVL
jgi:hypothetical protein